MSGQPRRIALVYDARRAYDLKVMAGVASYLQENRHQPSYSVNIVEQSTLKDRPLADVRTWQGDGIIADVDDPAVAYWVGRSRLPTVAFGCGSRGAIQEPAIPYFHTDGRAIARVAADHLLDRGFRCFAYCGYAPSRTTGWSQEREDAFVEYVRRRGGSCDVFRDPRRPADEWAATERGLGEWLMRLPKPVGVMAAHDELGRQVLEVCRADDLRVPQDVAVVGVDNNELLCLLSTPALSSVEQGARGLGYAAAMLLDELIQGAKPRQRQHVVDPVAVVTRRSTNVLAITDPKVAQALTFIQDHACDSIKVPQVAAAVAISRSGLEKRFASVLGYTIGTAIRRAQLERTRRLVLETDLALKQIAAETGFRSVQHMTTLYTRTLGVTPARHRRQSAPEPQLAAFFDGRLSVDMAPVHDGDDDGRQGREPIVPSAFRTVQGCLGRLEHVRER
jgi:LacI family transcriptional regulator